MDDSVEDDSVIHDTAILDTFSLPCPEPCVKQALLVMETVSLIWFQDQCEY